MAHFGFKLLRNFSLLFGGKGLSGLPFATSLYQFVYARVRPKGIVEVSAQGYRFFINSADTALAPYLIMRGVYAADETALLRKLLKPGMTYVDVGANIGYFSIIAAGLVGAGGKVIAFEPDEENFSLLQKNIARNGCTNIATVKKGLSDKEGTAQFYLNEKNLCSHTMVPRKGDRVVEIETTTLDKYFEGARVDPVRNRARAGNEKSVSDSAAPAMLRNVDNGRTESSPATSNGVNVIKIDVEGAEPLALLGMQQTIACSPKLALLTEFFPEALHRGGFDPKKYLDDLVGLGFTLYRIEGAAPEKLLPEDIDRIARGEGFRKLTYLLCLKGQTI